MGVDGITLTVIPDPPSTVIACSPSIAVSGTPISPWQWLA